jgi:hypothetical protein
MERMEAIDLQGNVIKRLFVFKSFLSTVPWQDTRQHQLESKRKPNSRTLFLDGVQLLCTLPLALS